MSIASFGVWLLLAAPVAAGDGTAIDPGKAKPDEKGKILWYDAQLLPIQGQGWDDTKEDYDRLPGKAEGKVRPEVWNLSRNSSGIVVPFITDATTIEARWTVTSDRLAMPHMPATGVSGLDLYVRDEGQWKWVACEPPTKKTTTATLVSGIPEGTREYLLYLPLYNSVSSLEIGIPKGKTLSAPAASEKKPIVFYGTSITHGASASRPGMVHTAIIGRKLDWPIINLGFSGNGRMETEVAEFLAELDPAVYVIDCLPNIGAKEVLQRTRPCVEILRKAHPDTPILLVEDRSYSDSFLVTSKRERNETSREALRKVYEELKGEGVKNLYYLEGERLLGADNEGTVDSSHPTDLGFMRQAEAFLEVLRPMVQK